jgi:hypothetical protein
VIASGLQELGRVLDCGVAACWFTFLVGLPGYLVGLPGYLVGLPGYLVCLPGYVVG